jgi:hypothetical protein
MPDTLGIDFLVEKNDWSKVEIAESSRPSLEEGDVLFAVDRFALTSNNISYAVAGDLLGYWKFFPAPEGMGRIPVMGYGDVIESRHPEIENGTRCFGFFPMSRFLRIQPGRVSANQIMDGAAHREGLADAYNQYSPVDMDPLHDPGHEDAMALLRGLFMTSFLADDSLDESYEAGVSSVLISSASSKTSIALAFCISRNQRARAIGLTSARNLEFVRGLGCYDEVLTYEEIESLDASKTAGFVDMAGNGDVIRRIHTHWSDNLRFSMAIGATHWQAGNANEALPGPKPEFFFAPAQIAKRSKEWGPGEMQKRLGEGWRSFRDFSEGWLEIRNHQGPEALREVYLEVLEGRSQPASGHMVSLSEK